VAALFVAAGASACGKARAPASPTAGAAAHDGGAATAPSASAGPLKLPPAPVYDATYRTSRRFTLRPGGAPKPLGAAMASSVAAAGPAFEAKATWEAGRCYRVEGVGTGVTAVSVAVRDTDGAIVAASSGPGPRATAPDGALVCPKARESVVITAAAGAGDGKMAVQVYVE
jgi:hypothetical protein